jgi:hypothetical protein
LRRSADSCIGAAPARQFRQRLIRFNAPIKELD